MTKRKEEVKKKKKKEINKKQIYTYKLYKFRAKRENWLLHTSLLVKGDERQQQRGVRHRASKNEGWIRSNKKSPVCLWFSISFSYQKYLNKKYHHFHVIFLKGIANYHVEISANVHIIINALFNKLPIYRHHLSFSLCRHGLPLFFLISLPLKIYID